MIKKALGFVVVILILLNVSMIVFKNEWMAFLENDFDIIRVKKKEIFLKEMIRSDSLESKIAIHKCSEIESLIKSIEYSDTFQLVVILNDEKLINWQVVNTYKGKILLYVNPLRVDSILNLNGNIEVAYKTILEDLNVNVFFLVKNKEIYFPFVSATYKDISINYLEFIKKWNQNMPPLPPHEFNVR